MNICGQLSGVPKLMHMTSNTSVCSGIEVLNHAGQHIGSIIVAIASNLSVSLDRLSKLGPAPLPIRREIDEVLDLRRVREYADILIQTLLKGCEVHFQCYRGALQPDVLLNITGKATTAVVAFHLYQLSAVDQQHLSSLDFRVFHRLVCIENISNIHCCGRLNIADRA